MVLTVNLNSSRKVDRHIFHCVGSGRLDLALRQDYLDSLKLAHDELGFKYVRAHGIFSKSMGIYREYEQDGQKRLLYNFTYLDQIFDSFKKIGIRPFLELGFMPDELASSKETVFWWQGNITPPNDSNAWLSLVKNTMKHLIERYGIEEVRQWPIEVWNEPNLTNFWKEADQTAYFELYRLTVNGIKSVSQDLQVGGPVICGGSDYWLKDFLKFIEKNNLPLDFLSRHAYSSGPSTYHGLRCDQEIMPASALFKDFETGHAYLEKYFHKQIPVYISEFNTSYTPDNPVHDTAFNAAYLAPLLARASESVESFSYWTFSDMFEEKGVPTSFLYGGFGLLTYRQIRKPTYYIYQFFSMLSDEEFLNEENTYVGHGKANELIIINWNSSDNPIDENINFLAAGSDRELFFEKTTINDVYGNVDTVWHQLGQPRFPNEQQIELLTALSKPKKESRTITVKNDQFIVENRVRSNEITMIRIFERSSDYETY